jgi:hypothetical protein
MFYSLLIGVLLIQNASVEKTPRDLSPDCSEVLNTFIAAAPEEVLREKARWLEEIQTKCPALPPSLFQAKVKMLEPCEADQVSAACVNVVETWQKTVKVYIELNARLKGVPEWVKPYWIKLQEWIQYFQGLV